MSIRGKISYHLPFILLLVIALFLRLNNLSTLTTFGRDQGIDFSTVKKMIVERKPTLIGIEVSIAQFHQGPVYLYMLVPLFLLLQFDPIAGAYTAVLISVITIALLYFFTKKFFGRKTALISSALFAVSPEFVREGNTPLYQHFLPLFLIIAIYVLLELFKTTERSKKHGLALFLGIIVGICLEIHFLAITFALAIFTLLFFKLSKNLKVVCFYFLGILIGVSPTIFFELKHQFLNTHLLWSYLTSVHDSTSVRSLTRLTVPWIESQTKWFGADLNILGVLIFAWNIYAFLRIRLKLSHEKTLRQLLLHVTGFSLFFEFGIGDFQAHYLLPLLVIELILIPTWIIQLKFTPRLISYLAMLIIICVSLNAVMYASFANHGYSMTDGWSLRKMQSITDIITSDAQDRERVNIASLIDGDARTYPLRYMLDVRGVPIDSFENYSNSKVMYLVSRINENEVNNSMLWEVASFKPFAIGQHWELGDGIQLFRLEKE
ncbi:MAG: glycosyltransferase family 39 protein [Patescibacteria group bacterium]